MSITTSVYIAASLDGFIARPDGSLDWLTGESTSSSEDYGYERFFASVDVLVLGRKTFETVLGFSPWPYENRRVVVLSRSMDTEVIPSALQDRVVVSQESPRELVKRLQHEGFRHVYVDGGRTIQSFLRAGQIDEVTITRIPVLLGSGVPLFGSLDTDVWFRHLETESFESGFVQSRYRVANRANTEWET